MSVKPVCVESVPATKGQTNYPAPFDSLVSGRTKIKLGNLFELTNFGVNFTRLEPGAISSLFHCHSKQDEFIYVLEGSPTVRVGNEEYVMQPGECMGFKAGSGEAHQLVNNSDGDVVCLEIGDRSADDSVEYPDDDIQAKLGASGSWVFAHKDGTLY